MNSCSNIVNVMGQDDVSSFDLREIVGFILVCGQRPKDLVITWVVVVLLDISNKFFYKKSKHFSAMFIKIKLLVYVLGHVYTISTLYFRPLGSGGPKWAFPYSWKLYKTKVVVNLPSRSAYHIWPPCPNPWGGP